MSTMRKTTSGAAIIAVLLLAGCSSQAPAAEEPDPFDAAWETCTEAYQQLPQSVAVLAEQNPGTEVSAETPCENWVDSQGRDDFTSFWTDPDEYMELVVTYAKLETGS